MTKLGNFKFVLSKLRFEEKGGIEEGRTEVLWEKL
jgi:hypothetical protein